MSLIASLYRRFQPRRGWLLMCLLFTAAVFSWLLTNLQVAESIEAMLPDGRSQVANDFRLLQQAPFAHKVIIHVRAVQEVPRADLLAATRWLQEALPEDFFSRPLDGPGPMLDKRLRLELGELLPRLVDEEDLAEMAAQLTPESVDQRLAEAFNLLLQPQGVAMKNLLRRDPLQLDLLALRKLSNINPIGGARLEGRQFISEDGRSSLILADTPVAMTDAAGSRELLQVFNRLIQQLPEGISAELISGHRYTLANATTIQDDMRRLLLLSACGILVVFLFLLRSLQALLVYLLPLYSLLAAVALTGLCWNPLSGITIGFGAVLLGITIDFGLHVYFAVRQGDSQVARTSLLVAVSRPVLFGGMTTLAAFAVLLRSELPGQRQLAVFTITGILVALLLALLVLPHFTGESRDGERRGKRLQRHLLAGRRGLRLVVLFGWGLVAVVAAWQAQQITVNGELRQLSYVPAELHRAEEQLSLHWGAMRGRALVFARDNDLEGALVRNERVWQEVKKAGMQDLAVSLAPLYPSLATQQQRLSRWQNFWQTDGSQVQVLLRDSGRKMGFSEQAFAPFWARLDETPQVIDRELLERWGLGPLLENLMLENDGEVQFVTLVPDQPEIITTLEERLSPDSGITVVSQARFSRQLGDEIDQDFRRFVSSAGFAVILLLVILFRRLSDVLLALLPVVTGLLVMFGGMVILGLEMNLFNVIASILIIGLGVDYGIFMVCHGQSGKDLASSSAVMVSGFTTMIGFGVLVFARHPALHSIGVSVFLGICAALPTALWVIPAFRPRRF